MKTIELRLVLTDDNKIATMETVKGLPQNEIESQLLIIGLLENIKQQHLSKLNTLYDKTIKRKSDGGTEDLDL